MATTPNFTGQQINLTYKSVLHFGNSEGLTVNQQDRIYDGSGVSTCLQLAPSGGTAIFDTDVRINELLYTGAKGSKCNVLYQSDDAGTLAMGNLFNVLSCANSNGTALNGTFSNVKTLTITDGLITGLTTAPVVKTLMLDLETFNPNVLSAAASAGTDNGVYPYNNYATQDYRSTSYWTPDAILIRNNYLEKVWSVNNPLYPTPIYGSPAIGDYAIVVSRPCNNTRDADYNINQFSKLFGLQYKFNGTSWDWLRTWQVNPAYSVEILDGRTTYEDSRSATWSVANFGPVDYATPALSATSPFYYSQPRDNDGNQLTPITRKGTNGYADPALRAIYNQIPASKILNNTFINADGSIPGIGTKSRNYGTILTLTLGKFNISTIGKPSWKNVPATTATNAGPAYNRLH